MVDTMRMVAWTLGGYLVLDGAGALPAGSVRFLSILGLTLVGLALIKR